MSLTHACELGLCLCEAALGVLRDSSGHDQLLLHLGHAALGLPYTPTHMRLQVSRGGHGVAPERRLSRLGGAAVRHRSGGARLAG